jgi:hypothetical protein
LKGQSKEQLVAIPKSQLETWSHRSQTNTAIKAHEDIRIALKNPLLSSVWNVDFDDYLQGSYRNYTNTVRDHDVDVVIQLNTSYTSDFSLIPYDEAASIQSLEFPATYSLVEFRPAVIAALRNVFGWESVIEGNKSLKVIGASGVKLDADVVVCQQHRLYHSTYPYSQHHHGISFYHALTGRMIVNFPRQHYDNGVTKQSQTNDWFKPTVRIFKNMRSYMIDRGLLASDAAPSYFLQGLLYNVPCDTFGGSMRQNFGNVLLWLAKNTKQFDGFLCQNGLVPLFGLSDEQWQASNAIGFIIALIELDQDWV